MICARCAREVAVGAQRCPNCAGDPLLDGRYRLDRQLASDSVGVSYQATRTEDAVLVRVRSCMLRRLPNEPERSARLTMLQELEHRGLPRWLDELVLGEDSLATLWTVHEHIRGQTLAELLAAAPEHRLDEAQTVALLRELADALAFLHEQRSPVVHGALSPALIQLRADGRGACLLDLGCASAAVHAASNRGLAESLAYWAPEQLHADASPASDVWTLGAIAAVMLSGASIQSLRDAAHTLRWEERIAATGQVDPKLADLLERMLEQDPARRISAAEVGEQLAGLGSSPARQHRTTLPKPSPPRAVANSRQVDVPVMRPDELSRELSQAQRVAAVLAQQKRRQLIVARVLVAIVTAVIAGLVTYVIWALT
jgi:serine/threonine protein kinase